jgi:OmpW family
MSARHVVATRLGSGLLIVTAAWAGSCAAQESPGPAAAAAAPATTDAAWWREGVARLGNLWTDARLRLRNDQPDWLHLRSRETPHEPLPAADAGATYLAVQEDRADGTDLLTVRYALAEAGGLRAYAGAGLNRTQYFVDDAAGGPTPLTRRYRRSGLGPAAELGAELELNQRVHLYADLRWADLDQDAALLRGDQGLVAADPLAFGVSIGYRFR